MDTLRGEDHTHTLEAFIIIICNNNKLIHIYRNNTDNIFNMDEMKRIKIKKT